MIPLEAIRSAIFSTEPFDQMHELVVAEMASGRKVNDIFEAFRPLIDNVLDLPALPKDGEEAFLSTLDALTGNCREDQCYVDPPETVPITNGSTSLRSPTGASLPTSNTAS